MTKQVADAWHNIAVLKQKSMSGQVSFDEARKLAKPFLAIINNRAKAVAQSVGTSCKPLTWGKVNRMTLTKYL